MILCFLKFRSILNLEKKTYMLFDKEGILMSSKFVINIEDKHFRFHLKAANGEIILSSQPYSSHAACEKGIESIRLNAPIAPIEDQTKEGFKKELNPKFEVYQYKNGDFRFRLKAKNGELIGTGQRYKSKSSCQNGIESIKTNSVVAINVEE